MPEKPRQEKEKTGKQERKDQRKGRREGERGHFRNRRAKRQHDDPREKRQRNTRRQNSRIRHMNRRADMGRGMEERVLVIGEGLVELGRIESIVYHEPHSPEDKEGRDFTVALDIDGKLVERSFGVTIGGNMQAMSSTMKHPDVPQFSFPWNINDETVKKRILGLFDDARESPQVIQDEAMRDFLTDGQRKP